MYYFSYGSNMSTARMQARVPSARVIAVASLESHTLRFHKAGRDGSAKCNILETNVSADIVYGVVFVIDATEKPHLDRVEGLGYGYEEKTVCVTGTENQAISATTYYATHIDERLKPFQWYKEHVVRGARENRLPLEYVVEIECIEAESDPDQARHDREILIYR